MSQFVLTNEELIFAFRLRCAILSFLSIVLYVVYVSPNKIVWKKVYKIKKYGKKMFVNISILFVP